MPSLLFILSATLMYSAPLVFAALGGVISERSGVINIGIEGMMVIGAFAATTTAHFTGNPWLGFVFGGLAGGILALLHAVACVFLKADQTISGVAMNLIGPGLSMFLCGVLFDGNSTTTPIKNKLPKILVGSDIDIASLMSLLLSVLIWFVFSSTKWGLRVRAVGENPAAADSLGISVSKIRVFSVILSGILAGFGGSAITLGIVTQFSSSCVAGQGFMALSALIFGKWKPFNTYLACLFFGFAQVLSITLNSGSESVLPPVILAILPYLLTISVLIFFVGKSVAPKANGVPYEKSML